MIITASSIKALFTGFNKSFQDGLAQAESHYTKVATTVKSSSRSTTYGWLGKFPKFREWVGDRQFNNMAAHSYAITNKKFESSIEVERDDIEDDELGIYAPLFTEMGQGTKEFPDEQVFGLLKDGFTKTCFDGQAFFDAEHPVYDKVDGAGEDGNGTFNAVSNMQAGTGDAWFLLDTSRSLKPIIWQERRPFVMTAKTDAKTSEATFMRDVYQYGVDGRANAGFGFWQMAFGSKADLTIDNLRDAATRMRKFRGDGDKVLNIRPKVLVVGENNRTKAEDILDKQFLAGGESNPMYKKFELLVVPYLD